MDSDGFFANFAGNARTARADVNAAIMAWQNVIQNFNYAGGGNTYRLDISAAVLPAGTHASTAFVRGDANGIPTQSLTTDTPRGGITLDRNGGGPGWYFDPAPQDNAEFTNLVNRFEATGRAGGPAAGLTDLYTVTLHEIGHAVGFSVNAGDGIPPQPGPPPVPAVPLRIERFMNPVPPAAPGAGGARTFTHPPPPAAPVVTATLDDPGHTDAAAHPNDLMNPMRGVNMRQLISDLDARILGAAYGYTIMLPSTIQTFLANFNTTSGVLTINADPQVANNVFTIDRAGANIRTNVNGIVAQFPQAAVTSVPVLGGPGNDRLDLNFANGNPIPVGGMSFNGGAGVDRITANANTNQYTLSDGSLVIAGMGTVALTSVEEATLTGGALRATFDVSGWTRTASLTGRSGADEVVSSNDANFTLSDTMLTRSTGGTFMLANIKRATLTGGPGNNTFTLGAWTGNATTIDGGPGTDTVVVGAGFNAPLALSNVEVLQITAGIVDLSTTTVQTLTLSGGTLTGIGVLSVTGSGANGSTWTGGTMSGSGTGPLPRTQVAANAALEVRNPGGFIEKRILRNFGTVRWTAGNLNLKDGGTVENLGNGRFEATQDGTVDHFGSVATPFDNQATFIKTGGTGVTKFDGVALNNSGTVQVNTGTVTLAGGGSASGNFTMASDAALNFERDYTLTNGATLGGPGVARVTAGTLTVTDNVSAEAFEVPAGILSGTGTLTVSRFFKWSGGTLSGTGTTRVTGTLEVSGAGVKMLDQRTLANAGTTGFWTDTGQVRVKNRSTFSNEAGAVLEARSDASYVRDTGTTTETFNNAGTFRKVAGTDRTTFRDVNFNNSGTVEVRTAKVAIWFGTYTQTAGTTSVGAGGTLESINTVDIQGGTLTGTGTVDADVRNAGTVTPAGDGAVGTLTIAGNYEQTANGTLMIEIGGVAANQYDRLAISGDANLGGTLRVRFINMFVPALFDSFQVLSFLRRNPPASDFAVKDFPNLNPNVLRGVYFNTNLTLVVLGPHFDVVASVIRTGPGAPFSLTVTALDADNIPIPNYQGTVHFASTDGAAILPDDYPFTSDDQGMHTFTGVILNTPGDQTITATDSVVSSITGSVDITVVAAGPLINGDFETGDFTGWTLSGATDYTFVSTDHPHSGLYSAKLGPIGSLGFMSQTVATIPGQTYQLTYWLAHDLLPGTPNEFQVSIGDNTVYDQMALGSFAYTMFSFDYLATGSTTTIQFGYREDPSFFYLDDVDFQPVGSRPDKMGPPSLAGTLIATPPAPMGVQRASGVRIVDSTGSWHDGYLWQGYHDPLSDGLHPLLDITELRSGLPGAANRESGQPRVNGHHQAHSPNWAKQQLTSSHRQMVDALFADLS